MSGQIDVGWTSPPFALDLLNEGKIRVIARASDVPEMRNQTVRFMTANATTLAARKSVFIRYMQTYRQVIDWMYFDPAAPKAFADWAHVSEALAKVVATEYYPRSNVLPDRIEGIDASMADAVAFKYISAPLTEEQLAELILVPLR
jgi:NitT/TauT family transport system substrate-binding protein